MHKDRLVAPPMVFIKGEEMTRYATQLMMDQWIEPHLDTSAWEFFDMSCASRDDTEDQVGGSASVTVDLLVSDMRL